MLQWVRHKKNAGPIPVADVREQQNPAPKLLIVRVKDTAGDQDPPTGGRCNKTALQ
jgi:hypothetical protein